MTVAEYKAYIQSIDDMEQRVINDNVYPKVRSNRCKAFCYVVSELTKECIRYFKYHLIIMPPKARPKSKTKIGKKPIPEDFELSSDEEGPKTITLTKEQRLMSKNIVINCPLCDGRIQLRHEI